MTDHLTTNTRIDTHLLNADNNLRKIIDNCETIEIELSDNYFHSLANLIIGQQLSNVVATVLRKRFLDLMDGDPVPEKTISAEHAELRNIGISNSKIAYLKNLSEAVLTGNLDLNNLPDMDNSIVMDNLTSVKGIGPWTAEMFLIFSLGRYDIFSTNDGGLKRSIQWLYNMEKKPTLNQLIEISEKWRPYRTFASLYLWRAIDEKMVGN